MGSFSEKLKSKIGEVKDKTTDAFVSPKALFEKNCLKYDCYSLEDLDNNTSVKAIISEDGTSIQFSGSFVSETKDIKGTKFFVGEDKKYFVVDESKLASKVEEIQQKSQVGTYETTVAPMRYVKLSLVEEGGKKASAKADGKAEKAAPKTKK